MAQIRFKNTSTINLTLNNINLLTPDGVFVWNSNAAVVLGNGESFSMSVDGITPDAFIQIAGGAELELATFEMAMSMDGVNFTTLESGNVLTPYLDATTAQAMGYTFGVVKTIAYFTALFQSLQPAPLTLDEKLAKLFIANGTNTRLLIDQAKADILGLSDAGKMAAIQSIIDLLDGNDNVTGFQNFQALLNDMAEVKSTSLQFQAALSAVQAKITACEARIDALADSFKSAMKFGADAMLIGMRQPVGWVDISALW